jgi:putative FmdB family regulatory protein
MPIYEYRCESCQREFMEIRAVGDHATVCAVCGGKLRRLFSGPARFRFRPKGWKPYTLEQAEGPETAREEFCVSE